MTKHENTYVNHYNKELMENLNEIKEELKKKNKDIKNLKNLIENTYRKSTKSIIKVFIITYGLVYIGFYYSSSYELFGWIGVVFIVSGILFNFLFPLKWIKI